MTLAVDLTKQTIETERLILRAWRKSDLNDFYAYASIKGVGEMAGWKHHTSIDVTKDVLASFIKNKNVFALVFKENSKVIGSLGIHSSWLNEKEAYKEAKVKELGFVLAQDYWARGLMPEALKAVISFCFEEYALTALTVSHFSNNYRSKRVIEKCSFKYFNTSKIELKEIGETLETKEYILERASWLKIKDKWKEK